MQFSANLGFLWKEIALPDAIHKAAAAGFAAVECHWPYATSAQQVKQALSETGIPMLSLNAWRGDVAGDHGLTALPGREKEARAAIDQAIAYAQTTGTNNIHMMAGNASGDVACKTYIDNLRYATRKAEDFGITILIEPLNHFDAPGYFLSNTELAVKVIDEVAAPNLKLMFDCYHLQIMQGDISRNLRELMPIIGHIQIASVPDRAEPDGGELNYRHIMDLLEESGYSQPIGAEYKPQTSVEAGLGWMKTLG
jgi:2-dehydrotetronate isomerase